MFVTDEDVKKLQDWYYKKNGWELSEKNAREILELATWWGESTFVAAYEIMMGYDPQTMGI